MVVVMKSCVHQSKSLKVVVFFNFFINIFFLNLHQYNYCTCQIIFYCTCHQKNRKCVRQILSPSNGKMTASSSSRKPTQPANWRSTESTSLKITSYLQANYLQKNQSIAMDNENEPIITYEALTFFSATLVAMLQIIENLDRSFVEFPDGSIHNTKAFANFLVGTAISIFGLMLTFRTFFGTSVLRGDVGVAKNIEVFCLCLAFLFTVLALMTIVAHLNLISGISVWVSSCIAAILVGYANISKYDEVRKEKKLLRTLAHDKQLASDADGPAPPVNPIHVTTLHSVI